MFIGNAKSIILKKIVQENSVKITYPKHIAISSLKKEKIRN